MRKLLLNPLVRWMLMVLCAALLLFGLSTAFAPTHQSVAQAGTNGQVVEFDCAAFQMWDVYVYGYNQDGNYAAWHGNANGGHSVVTYGWYWKGNVHIDWWYSYNGGSWGHRDYYVPVHYSGNTYPLSC